MTVATKPEDLSAREDLDPLKEVHSDLIFHNGEKGENSRECLANDTYHSTAKERECLLGKLLIYSAFILGVVSLSFCLILSIFLYKYHAEIGHLSQKVQELEGKLQLQYHKDMGKFRFAIRDELPGLVRDVSQKFLQEQDGSIGMFESIEMTGGERKHDLDVSSDIPDEEKERSGSGAFNRNRRTADRKGHTKEQLQHAPGPNNRRHERRKRNRHCSRCPKPPAIFIDHLGGNSSVSQGTDFGGADPTKKEDVYRNWNLAEWSTGQSRFNRTSGELQIKENGIYFVYVQIMFINSHLGANGFDLIVIRNNPEGDLDKHPIISCKHSVDYYDHNRTESQNIKYKTCYSARPVMLREGNVLAVKSRYAGRKVLFHESTSFWGVIRFPTGTL